MPFISIAARYSLLTEFLNLGLGYNANRPFQFVLYYINKTKQCLQEKPNESYLGIILLETMFCWESSSDKI